MRPGAPPATPPRAAALAPAALATVLATVAACGPPPTPPPPLPPPDLTFTPRLHRDARVGRAVIVPALLAEVTPGPGVWLSVELRDAANPTAVRVDFPLACDDADARAVPCSGGAPCLVSWRGGEERLAGRVALTLGEHEYWWPGPVPYCARVTYSLGPGPYAAAVERLVLDFPTLVKPARRPPARPPAPPAGSPRRGGGEGDPP